MLKLLGIIGTTGSPANYGLWTKNCGGLTYATTVADTLKTLQEAYLGQQFTCTTPIALSPAPSGKPEKFTLSLTQRIHGSPFQRDIKGQISAEDATPVKDGQIEIIGHNAKDQTDLHVQTKTHNGGTFALPFMTIGTYQFRLTLDGFRTMIGTLNVSLNQSSVTHLRSID